MADSDVSHHGRSNLIARNWRGELPLWVSYWIFGTIGTIAVAATVALLGTLLSPELDYVPGKIMVLYCLVWPVIGVVSVWQLVGVWRSASSYRAAKATQNKTALWASIAQFAVVMGVLNLVSTIISQAIPQLTEVTKIALLGDPDMPAYQMRLMRDGTEIEITGGFKYGMTDDFLRVIAAAPRLRVIHLNSPGGRIGEAKKLKGIISERGLVTYTSRDCASACVVAFVGGRERWLGIGGRLGFHAGSFAGTDINFAQDMLKPLGASQSFIAHASNTPPNNMWYPTTDELLSNNIIKGVANSYMFGMSGYGPNISQEEAAKELKTTPLFMVLAETNQQVFNQLIDIFYASYERGDTEGSAQDKLRTIFVPYIQSLRPLGDDATLADLERLMTDQLKVLRSKDPKLCFEYALGTNPSMNFSSYFGPELISRELALEVRIMKTANVANRKKPTEAQLLPYQQAIYQHLLAQYPKAKVDIVFKQNFSPADQAPYCDVSIAMFEEIAQFADPGRATMIRNIFSQ